MKENFDYWLNLTWPKEGGFANNVRDPGGATNLGITLRTLTAWRRRKDRLARVTINDVLHLTKSEATAIYGALYWNVISGNELPDGLDGVLFDYDINSGGHAAHSLQEILGFTGEDLDGDIGPYTLSSVSAADPVDLINKVTDARIAYFSSLPTDVYFDHSWRSRTLLTQKQAIELRQSRGLSTVEVETTPASVASESSAVETLTSPKVSS